MASTDTEKEAQDMIDFMLINRPNTSFKIVKDEHKNSYGKTLLSYYVFELATCEICGGEIWHVDYGNEEVCHFDCELEKKKKFYNQLKERIKASEERNEFMNWISDTDG